MELLARLELTLDDELDILIDVESQSRSWPGITVGGRTEAQAAVKVTDTQKSFSAVLSMLVLAGV